jgi:simple sugar transport system permease protein
MTEPLDEQPKAEPAGYAPSVAERLAFYQRAGGVITPIFTVVLAFLAGGLVVLATGHNPLRTYKAVWDGTGLNWFFHFGSYHIDLPFTSHRVFFWWDTNTNGLAAYNLTQTFILTTTLILTGIAVAFAFRCGLFNIGGQGQYLVGTYLAVWVGSSFKDMPALPHIVLAIVAACAGGGGPSVSPSAAASPSASAGGVSSPGPSARRARTAAGGAPSRPKSRSRSMRRPDSTTSSAPPGPKP